VSVEALGLYLFLVTVGDFEGLSYFSDRAIGEHLSLDGARVAKLRLELIRADLIAYKAPLYQVLSLDRPPSAPVVRELSCQGGTPQTVADVLRTIVSKSA